ncbi:metallopeptidase [Candidatus Shapirobacteria bacterium CG10_big_fil_rev_8_21_14_0_10_48_15]|uniref:Metallopeptidase n=1 Tax=Candidatus Shapirobacteria bacterium CG10_big_fil_rev_8_21_14_0_10_48_15 TaxID=1974484 RepID=A0A2M8L7R6_9BACT|nr:MAG: metallopeptidase [Candidatus Shapirobacteria bacterium CG10_big_fil_rev_8_21_14_0_10_48_15]
MNWHAAPDIHQEITKIISRLRLGHLNPKNIFAFRSQGSRARARARIWGFPRIWQQALNQSPCYCLEVIAEKFDHLSSDNQRRILIHELLHIPQNFSGALLPHRHRKVIVGPRQVEALFKKLRKV